MTIPRIHKNKTPIRRHYVAEWAEKYGLSKAAIARGTGADKSLVGKWFNDGVLPGDEYLNQLALLFETDPEALFRHPDEDWLARFFKDRLQSEEDRERAKLLLDTVFPRPGKTG